LVLTDKLRYLRPFFEVLIQPESQYSTPSTLTLPL